MGERYWCVTASADHAAQGVVEGIVQACHGKAAPLRRMRAGDGVVIYAPRDRFAGGAPFQAFAAIGRVAGDEVWQEDMGGGFLPFRRRVLWWPARPVPIRPLLDRLELTRGRGRKDWGMVFRYGFFPLPPADFALLAREMAGQGAFAPGGEAPYSP